MNDPTPAPSPEPITPEKPGGFFENLTDLYFEPRKAFGRIVANPSWVLPFLGYLTLVLIFTGVWLNYMEPAEFMKTQLQESGQWDKLTPEQRQGVIDQQAKFVPIMSWVSALVFTPILFLVASGALLFVFRFFYAAEVRFKQAFAVVCWSFLAVALVTTPLTLGVMAMKGDWNINPQEALQANPSLLLDKGETAKPLWALVTSFDLFSFWLMFLLASGFGVASRRATGSAFWGVAIPWALIIAGKVGWAALF
jgi:hypothetical protein